LPKTSAPRRRLVGEVVRGREADRTPLVEVVVLVELRVRHWHNRAGPVEAHQLPLAIDHLDRSPTLEVLDFSEARGSLVAVVRPDAAHRDVLRLQIVLGLVGLRVHGDLATADQQCAGKRQYCYSHNNATSHNYGPSLRCTRR